MGLPKYNKTLEYTVMLHTAQVSSKTKYIYILYKTNKNTTVSMMFQSSKLKVWVSPPFRVICSAAAVMPPTASPLSNFNSLDI